MKIAINGFGRIGRAVFRILDREPDIEVVAINDLSEPAALRYLLSYDTVMGNFGRELRYEDGCLITKHNRTKLLSEKVLRHCPGPRLASMPSSSRPACSARRHSSISIWRPAPNA